MEPTTLKNIFMKEVKEKRIADCYWIGFNSYYNNITQYKRCTKDLSNRDCSGRCSHFIRSTWFNPFLSLR